MNKKHCTKQDTTTPLQLPHVPSMVQGQIGRHSSCVSATDTNVCDICKMD